MNYDHARCNSTAQYMLYVGLNSCQFGELHEQKKCIVQL